MAKVFVRVNEIFFVVLVLVMCKAIGGKTFTKVINRFRVSHNVQKLDLHNG